jgi:hypothetical protein
MAGYLWVFWRYARGAGWPASTSSTRRANSRANGLAEELWGPALLAGLLGLVGVLLLQGILSRLVTLPQQRDLDVSRYSTLVILVWVLMSAVVAGVVEETSDGDARACGTASQEGVRGDPRGKRGRPEFAQAGGRGQEGSRVASGHQDCRCLQPSRNRKGRGRRGDQRPSGQPADPGVGDGRRMGALHAKG